MEKTSSILIIYYFLVGNLFAQKDCNKIEDEGPKNEKIILSISPSMRSFYCDSTIKNDSLLNAEDIFYELKMNSSGIIIVTDVFIRSLLKSGKKIEEQMYSYLLNYFNFLFLGNLEDLDYYFRYKDKEDYYYPMVIRVNKKNSERLPICQ